MLSSHKLGGVTSFNKYPPGFSNNVSVMKINAPTVALPIVTFWSAGDVVVSTSSTDRCSGG
jgi:hypothetical protein